MRYLLTVHDISFMLLPKMASWSFRTLYSLWLKRSLALADHVVTDSENTKQDIVRQFNIAEDCITTVHLAVSADFKPLTKKSSRKPYLLTVATHPFRKNLELLIEAFIILSRTRDLDLKVVGHLNESCIKLLKAAHLESKVQIVQNVPESELINLYQGTTAFVYPSLYEGFGLPVLEAMACGVPALCSDNSSLPEVQIDPHQRFKTNDLKGLINLLSEVVDKPSVRSQFVKRNIINSKNFSWDKTARGYQQVINAL